MLKTQMYPITKASLEEWCAAKTADEDLGEDEGYTAEDILEALDRTIEQLADVYLEVYQASNVEVPAGSMWCCIQALASYGFGEYEIVRIDAYQDNQWNIYADIEDLI